MGVLPDNRVKLLLFIEGKNDENFLKRIAKLFSLDLSDVGNKGELIFLTMGGKNLQEWVNRMAELNRKEIYIYDRDNVPEQSTEPNRFQTSRREMENYIHPDVIENAYKKLNIEIEIGQHEIQDNTDVPALIAEKVHRAGEGQNKWSELDEVSQKKKESQVKKLLNTSAVEKMTEEQLREVGGWNEIEKWMDAIKDALKPQ